MLTNTSKIELVTVQPDGGWRLVAIVERGEWDQPDATWLLQEKLNALASYALDGQMRAEYPDSVGKPITLVICPVDPVPADIRAFIDQVAQLLAPEGLSVSVEPLPPEEQPAAA